MNLFSGILLSTALHIAAGLLLSLTINFKPASFEAQSKSDAIIVRFKEDVTAPPIKKIAPPTKEKILKKSITQNQKTVTFNNLITHFENPEYPIYAVRKSLEGSVTLKLKINNSGRVEKVEVQKTSGYSILDESAAATALKWRFKENLNKEFLLKEIIFKLN